MLLLAGVMDLLHCATTVRFDNYSVVLFAMCMGGKAAGRVFFSSAFLQMKNSPNAPLIIRHLEKIWTCELGLGGLLTMRTTGMYSIFRTGGL